MRINHRLILITNLLSKVGMLLQILDRIISRTQEANIKFMRETLAYGKGEINIFSLIKIDNITSIFPGNLKRLIQGNTSILLLRSTLSTPNPNITTTLIQNIIISRLNELINSTSINAR